MTNEEKYKMLLDENIGLASDMGIYPLQQGLNINYEKIKQSLEKVNDLELLSLEEINELELIPLERHEDNVPINGKAYIAGIKYKEDTFSIYLALHKTENLNLQTYALGNMIEEEYLEAAFKQPEFLFTSINFSDDALASFHLQLKVMHAIVSEACVCIDFMTFRLLSPKWLAITAQSLIPPSPDYLYTMHAVYDEKDGERTYWFHTHGLHRCKSVELEMVNIKQGAQEMHTLLNMVAKRFLSDKSLENEKFVIGYDGMGINVSWLRWEEALKDFPSNILGGLDERNDDTHSEPSGIIFAVEDGNMVSPEIYATTLANNPIFYITNEETERMSALAKERFHMFKDVFLSKQSKEEKKSLFGKIFGSKKTEEEQWEFIVKLGLTTDNPDENSEKEHLWFEVLAIDDNNNITGKLMNQPYWIADLNEGEINSYPMDLLTDWLIYGSDETYSTDTIYRLGFS